MIVQNAQHRAINRSVPFAWILILIGFFGYPAVAAIAKAPTLIPLEVQQFTDLAKKDPRIGKLEWLVLQRSSALRDRYITLSKNHFMILSSIGARLEKGLYLADLRTNTIKDLYGTGSAPHVLATLKDKSGGTYLLLEWSSETHRGYGGSAYSLLSAWYSQRGRPIISKTNLGHESTWSEEVSRECGSERFSTGTRNVDAQLRVKDLNDDGYSDISIAIEELHCPSAQTKSIAKDFIATEHGFLPGGTPDPTQTTAKLLKAHKRALKLYSPRGITLPLATLLEENGIRNILYEKPSNMPLKHYVRMLNDYAFFLAPYSRQNLALDVFDRVISLAPRRAVAFLNRAGLLYQMLVLGDFLTQEDKVAASQEIMADYVKYKRLTGKRIEKFELFKAFNMANYPKGMDVCSYVRKYIEADNVGSLSRMGEIYLGPRRLDLNNDGRIDDIVTKQPQRGVKTHSKITIRDEKGKAVPFTPLPQPYTQGIGRWYTVIGFEGKYYRLFLLNWLTMIDQETEVLVCDSEYETIYRESRDDRLCQAVLDGDTESVQFDKPYSLRPGLKLELAPRRTVWEEKYASIDIDNDGKQDAIGVLASSRRNSKRKDSYLVALDRSLNSLRQDKLNTLLSAFQSNPYERCKGAVFNFDCAESYLYGGYSPFLYEGKAYIDRYQMKKGKRDFESIHKIEKGRVEQMCRFGRSLKSFKKVAKDRIVQ